MKVAHVSTYCHLGSRGGTERYLCDLAAGLEQLGWGNVVFWMHTDPDAAPRAAPGDPLPVLALPRSPMRVDAPPADLAARAEAALEVWKPDVLHFHSWGRSEHVLAELAQRRGLPIVFTYHSPAWTCRRETLLRWGGEPCDGEVRTLRCSACKLQERLGSAPWAGWAGALLSAAVGPLAGHGTLRRRVAFTADTALYRRDLREFLGACRCVVACAEWSLPVLAANGARAEALLHLPQGVPSGFAPPVGVRVMPREFTVGYIGRMMDIKGIHLLVEAFRAVEDPDARLRVYGWSEAPDLRAYGQHLRRLAGDDPRIVFVPEQPPSAMPAAYASLSLLAIPSVWMETGPLTLLEALQGGLPVYASSRMGQRGLVARYGRVVEPNTPAAWAAALREACRLHRAGAWQPVHLQEPLLTMEDVAARMAVACREVLPA